MRTIKRVSLSEQVVNSIAQYIQDNGLKAGDQLPTENEFSELFGVSRTSVREAMKALSINGILVSTPGKGTFLQPKAASLLIDRNGILQLEARSTIAEVMEVRSPLEVKAVELAVERGSDEDITNLCEITRNYRQAVESGGEHSVWGKKFHTLLAAMSDNALLTSTLQSLADVTNLYRGNLAESSVAVDYYMESHEAICSAFLKRDAAAAAEEMRLHMEATAKALKELVNEDNATRFIPRE